ncbi:PREDICTED: F-box/kelch-repeat protein At3g06240-like [Fragaria vesca subsp. vesca]|uniref:F-box/kelch-repeat protein At3g06240-like n=1 Tax=Fragaria vesca subsp. vesca TaxID=101020 RepID=UPI0002C2E44C|nr:PREDICTED: F-box/kelch-repeat protein At3g06240-like [Fragaria vesca subsp. vesca]
MSDYLPEDLIYKILTGLPAKSLMRFKCVSKRWRSLISDSQFAKTHLQLASTHQTLIHGFLVCSSPHIPQLESSVLESPSFGDSSSPRKLAHPTEEEGLPVLLLGSCNGFVFTCLGRAGHPSRNYSIWNPTTGFFLDLPDPEFPYYDDHYFRRFIHHGIGYVHETDEYKVVVSSYDVSTLKVLSLRDQYWREKTCPHQFVDHETEGVGLQETLHWVVFDYEHEPPLDPEPYMVAFELRNEDFRIMQLPLAATGEDLSLALFSWRGCMYL